MATSVLLRRFAHLVHANGKSANDGGGRQARERVEEHSAVGIMHLPITDAIHSM